MSAITLALVTPDMIMGENNKRDKKYTYNERLSEDIAM